MDEWCQGMRLGSRLVEMLHSFYWKWEGGREAQTRGELGSRVIFISGFFLGLLLFSQFFLAWHVSRPFVTQIHSSRRYGKAVLHGLKVRGLSRE